MNQRTTAAVLLAASSLYVTSANITASLPIMVNVFNNIPRAEFLVKLALTLPALLIAFIAPVSGIISDKFGRKKILIISLVIYGIGGFSGYILKDLRSILVGRAILGLGLGTLFTTASALIGDYFTGRERAKVLSLQGAFVSFGGLLFVGGSGFLAEISWKYPFVLYLVSLLIVPAAVIILKEPEHSKKPVSINKSDKKKYPVKLVVFINISVFICMVFFLMIHTQLPFFLHGLQRNSTSLMGILMVLLNIVGFFTASAYIRIRRKLSYTMIYGLFFFSMGVGFYLMGLGSGNMTLFAGILFCGVSAGLVIPNTSIWLQEITSVGSRGRIMGIMTACAFLGQFLSPVIMQPVIQLLPKGSLFSYVGMFMIVLGIIYGGLSYLLIRSPGRAY